VTPRAAALGVALAVAATVTGSAVASASTISGGLTGVKLPAKGKGVATVRAVSPKTFAIVAADRVSGGRFSLSVPAGAYFLLGTSAPLGAKTAIDRNIGTVKVKKGARKHVRLSLKPKKKKRPQRKLPPIPGLPTARAAFVNVDYPAVWQKHFKVTGDPAYRVLGKGLAQMLITDVGPPLAAACNGSFVERDRLDTILTEHALQQSGLTDPATRIDLNKLVAHNKEVTGTIAGTEKDLTITATVTDVLSGGSRTVTHHGTDGFFALEPKLVPDLVKLICGDKPPERLVGTIKGDYGIPEYMLRWSGDVRLKYNGLGPGGPGTPDGKYATYVVEGGSLHVTLDGTDGQCTIHGEGDFPLVANLGEFATLQQDVDERAYTLAASFPNGTEMPYTSTGPGCTGAVYPLSGRVYMTTHDAKTSSSDVLVGSTTVNLGVPVTWSWSLQPVY
jgi:Curli production assembly/transport component CsgG